MQVNAETLQERIKSLQALGNAEYALPLTLNEEYQLEAYKMLLQLLKDDARADCHCDCQFWHYDESREQCICNSCLGVKVHD